MTWQNKWMVYGFVTGRGLLGMCFVIIVDTDPVDILRHVKEALRLSLLHLQRQSLIRPLA